MSFGLVRKNWANLYYLCYSFLFQIGFYKYQVWYPFQRRLGKEWWQEFSAVPQSRPGLWSILHPSPYDHPYHAIWGGSSNLPYNSLGCHLYLGPCSGVRAILHPSPGRPYAYQGLPDVTTSGQFPTEVLMYSHIKG